jgi:hypothetical protein
MQDGELLVIKTEKRLFARLFEINGEAALPGEYNVLSVVDSGMGIDFVTLLHFFEAFLQPRNSGP